MQEDFLLWHIAGVAVEGWRGLFFLTFTVKNILHFIQLDLCSTEVKYVITFFWVIIARKWDDSQTETIFC